MLLSLKMDANQFQEFVGAVRGNGGNAKKPPRLAESTPGAWRIWRRNFTIIADHRGWGDERRKMEAASSMDKDAAQITFDLAHDNAEQTAVQFLDAMERRW